MAARPSAMPRSPRAVSRRRRRTVPVEAAATLERLVAEARVELIPMGSLARATGELAPGSVVSMTCSPAKTIEATLDESETLLALGHRVVPHISARMVTSHEHLGAIRQRLAELGMREIFVVGGDADPPGCFFDAIEFLEAFLELDDAAGPHGRAVDHIGITAYPDSHPLITTESLRSALHRKQAMILATGRTAHATTQMCFSADRIRTWLAAERAAGLDIGVHLGVPGVIDRAKLMTMGVRLGVGSSLRYLKKNRRALGRMMTQRSFTPDDLLLPLAGVLDELGIDGIHLFSFNQVAATESWRSARPA